MVIPRFERFGLALNVGHDTKIMQPSDRMLLTIWEDGKLCYAVSAVLLILDGYEVHEY